MRTRSCDFRVVGEARPSPGEVGLQVFSPSEYFQAALAPSLKLSSRVRVPPRPLYIGRMPVLFHSRVATTAQHRPALFSALGLSLSVLTAAAADPSPIGQWGITKPARMFIACDTVDSLSRYGELVHSGDASAATIFMSDHCVWFKSMTEVMVEQSSAWTGTLCVRPRGDIACAWVQGDAVEIGADADRDKAAKVAKDAQDKADAEKSTASMKALNERVDKAFDSAHPECKAWRTNKHLPDYC